MNFKSVVYGLTDDEFANAYRKLDCSANDRETDLNSPCVKFMLQNLYSNAESMLDVGCGRGYWLNKVAEIANFKINGLRFI